MSALSKIVPNVISTKFGRQALILRKNSPTILLGVGLVGAVTSTVMACNATLKLEETLGNNDGKVDQAKNLLAEEMDKDLDEQRYNVQDYNRDVAILKVRTAVEVCKLYGPALSVGLVSIGCLTGSHVILNRRNLAITAAYGVLDKGFREYRERVVEEFGLDKDLELKYGVEEKEILVETETGPQIERVKKAQGTSVYAALFDDYTRNWKPVPETNAMFIRAQQNWANDLLRSQGHIFLNEVYDMLGMKRTTQGSVVGWVLNGDGDNYVDFGLNDDRPSAIDFLGGLEASVLLDFNVDGVIYDKI